MSISLNFIGFGKKKSTFIGNRVQLYFPGWQLKCVVVPQHFQFDMQIPSHARSCDAKVVFISSWRYRDWDEICPPPPVCQFNCFHLCFIYFWSEGKISLGVDKKHCEHPCSTSARYHKENIPCCVIQCNQIWASDIAPLFHLWKYERKFQLQVKFTPTHNGLLFTCILIFILLRTSKFAPDSLEKKTKTDPSKERGQYLGVKTAFFTFECWSWCVRCSQKHTEHSEVHQLVFFVHTRRHSHRSEFTSKFRVRSNAPSNTKDGKKLILSKDVGPMNVLFFFLHFYLSSISSIFFPCF